MILISIFILKVHSLYFQTFTMSELFILLGRTLAKIAFPKAMTNFEFFEDVWMENILSFFLFSTEIDFLWL